MAIATIIKTTLKQANLDRAGTAYFDPQLNNLTSYYKQIDNGKYWVAELDEKVVGGCGIAPITNQLAELQKLYVDSRYTGEGIGTQLLDKSLNYAKKHYRFLYLETFQELTAANSLYLKKGFLLLETPLGNTGHTACDTWYLKDFSK